MRGTAQALVLLTFLSGTAASAAPVEALDLATLAARATGVATGRVTAAKVSAMPGDTAREVLTVAVDRWIKSPGGAASRTITVDLPAGSESVSEGQYGTFYLALDAATNHMVPVNPAHVLTPAAAHLVHAAASGDPLAALADELANVFDTPLASLNALNRVRGRTLHVTMPDPYVVSSTDRPVVVATGALAEVQAIYGDAMDAMATLPAARTHAALLRLSRSADPLVQLWAMIGLLRQDDWSGVALSSSVLVESPLAYAQTIGAAASALMAAQKSAGDVPALVALLGSRSIDIRRSAAAGLRDIATPDVVRPLGRVGLRDGDQMVRYYAVTGLAAATGEGEVPATDAFASGESRYRTFWSGWLNEHAVN